MYGASTNRTTSLFLSPVSWWKAIYTLVSLYFRVLHRANIAVRAAFDHHRAFQRRKQADTSWRERCRLPACGINSLFLALTRHISASFCALTLVIPLAGKHWTTIYWLLVEEPELNLLVSACMQHWLRLTIGEPEKSTTLARFPNSS